MHHSLSLTKSLSSIYNVFILCPLKFFISHLLISVWLLFLRSSSKFFSNSVANISPVTFLQLGLWISSLIVSTRTYSFSKIYRMLRRSEANFCSSTLIYSRTLLSDSLKASSTNLKISSRKALSSLWSTFDMLLRNWSIR